MSGLSFDILARDKASPAFDKVSKSVEKTEKKFGFLAARTGGLTAGMTAGFGKIAGAMVAVASVQVFKGFIDEARESRKVGALTESIIKSTGGAAKISAKQVGDLATAISNKTGVDDEAIQSGSNLLLTFKNVRNEVGKGANVFDRATEAAVDLSAAGFGDVNSASKMLGKALNDPLKGLTALGKAGVTFTEDQKKQIATLVETGKTLEAQKIILQEVESQVGGAAAAAADPMAKLGVIIGNTKEAIGTAFLPMIDKTATALGKFIPDALGKASMGLKAMGAAFRGEGITSDGFVGVMEQIGVTAGRVFNVFKTVALPRLRDLGGFLTDKIVPSLGDFLGFITKWPVKVISGLRTGFTTGDWGSLGKAIGGGLITAVRGIGDGIDKIGSAIGGLIDRIDWGKLGSKIGGALRGVFRNVDWGQVGDALGDSVVTIFKRATTLGEKIGNAFRTLMDKVDWNSVGRDSTNAIGRFVSGVDWGSVAKSLGQALLKSMKVNAKIGLTINDSVVDLVEGMVAELGKAIGKWFAGAGSWLLQKGRDLVSGLKGGASEQASGIGSWFTRNLITPVTGAFTGAGKWLLRHGRDLITGFKDGVWDFAKGLDDWMTRAPVAKLIAPWHAAGKWLLGPGKNVIAGLISGVGSAAKNLGNWVGRNVISPVVGGFSKAGSWLVQNGKNLVAGLQSGISSIARGIGNWVGRNVISPTVSGFTRAGTWLVQHGKNFVAGLKSGISSIAGSIGRWAYDRVIVPVVTPFGKAGTWLATHGANMIAGLKNGVVGQMKTIASWIKAQVVDPIIKATKHFFGIKSPSKVFEGIGGHLIGGLMKGLGAGRGSAIAKKVFGDMPSALRHIVGKGLIPFSKLGGKALDALGFGADFTVPGVIPGALSGPNRRVFYQGEALDFGTYNKLAKAMKMVGGVNVTQGSYERASSYSGSTHTGGGVFDVVGGNLTKIMSGLKASGLVGWIRNPSQGPWPWHIHALDPGETGRMSASARAQVADYYRGGNGLAGYLQGTPWVPNDQVAHLHKGEAVIPRKVNEARLSAGRSTTVVLEFRSDGSAHMDYLIREFRKYVRVNGGDVQAVFGS
jgi:acid phosphatase family membrane protein YuiD